MQIYSIAWIFYYLRGVIIVSHPCTLGEKLVQEQEYRILLIMPGKFILVPCFCSLEIACLTHILTNIQLKYFQGNFCIWHVKKTSLCKGFCNMPFAPTD